MGPYLRMLIKRFKLDVIAGASDFTVVDDLGYLDMFLYSGSDRTTVSGFTVQDITTADISSVTSKFREAEQYLASPVVTGTYNALNEGASYLQSRFPLVAAKNFSSYTSADSSKRLRLLDPVSGYYAISRNMVMNYGSTFNANCRVNGWDAYNSEGTLIISGNGLFHCLTDLASVECYNLYVDEYGDIIPGSAGYMRVALTQNQFPKGIVQYSTRTVSQAEANWWNGVHTTTPVIPTDDPYSGGGTSEPGGGDGDFDFSSTDIPIPTLPAIGSYDTGFISLYNPTAAQLKSLAQYMWSGAFDPDNFRKLVADPMDAILGLHIIPTIAGHPSTGSATLMVGNISTGITMPTVTEQYYELDCGTISISPKWGAYLDYAPYSKLTLFLPYIGFVPISPDDCMNGSIRVVYHVDVLSGTCCAYVYCESNRGADGHTLYTFTGSCACDCPVTEGQYTNALFGMLGVVGGIAQVAMSAGVAGAAGIPGTAQGLQNVANAAISMAKPDIARSGDFGGSAGLMGIQYPYLVLTVPRMCTPEDQNIYIGYPSFITKEMSELSGYTEIQVSHLSGMSCTSGEADEIIALLGGGVIF